MFIPSRYRAQPFGALAEMMARDREREDVPFGGFAGEMASPPREPAPPAPPPLVIPPAPWADGGQEDPAQERTP